MEQSFRDLRHSIRMLVKNPGIACLAMAAFALGVGSTTTMFSVGHGLLRDMPYERLDRLVYLSMNAGPGSSYDEIKLSVHEISEWRDVQSTLEGLGAFYDTDVNLSGAEGQPERVSGGRVTANAFEMLRVRPTIGRGFLPEDERPGAQPVTVLGHRLWSTRFRGDVNVAGSTIRINGVEHTVVGVMPEWFRFPYNEELWVPLELNPTAIERGDGRYLMGIGRLRDGVSLDEARTEYAGLLGRLRLAYPDDYGDVSARLIPFKEHIVGPEDVLIINAMVGLVSFVLLIACANVANLLLAHAAARSREVAVRTALGASRARVIGQLLVEAVVISTLGGIGGVALAWIGTSLVNHVLGPEIPFHWMQISMDRTVLLFAFGLVLLSGVIAGTVPAFKATGVNVNDVLKDEARGASGLKLGRLSRALVVGEVALSCGLLTVSGLMVKGILIQTASDLAFATEDVFTASVTLLQSDYPEDAERDRFYRELLSRLETRPGVHAAGLVSHLPGVSRSLMRMQTEGGAYDDDTDLPYTNYATISPEFFRALGVGLIEGREFSADDNGNAQPVAIVNQRFAERFFPGESPLGRRVRAEYPLDTDWMTIVGVAPDLAMNRRREARSDGIYVPYSQRPRSSMSVLLRTHVDPLAQTPMVREVVASLDPHLPVYQPSTLAREISRVTLPDRTLSFLFLVFGLAALLLATVGLYGVMAFSVRRRTKEIGIRLALGALSGRILWLAFKGGLAQLVVGLTLGVGLAALIAPGMGELLYDAGPWDWNVYLLIALCLGATGVVASLVPATRATRVDPMEILRYE